MSHNHLHQVSLPDTSESSIEHLDLSHNTIKDIHIPNDTAVKSLVKLNLSHNKIEQLPEAILHATKLQELQVGQNRLRVLFKGEITLPSLVRLHASDNQLTQISTGSIDLPKLVEVSLGNNRMTEEGMIHLRGAPNILTLDISSNKLQDIPLAAIVCLTHLQRLDIRANDIHQLPCELGQFEELKTIHLEGNPMRVTSSMTHLIESLRSKFKSQQQENKLNEQADNSIDDDDDAAFDKDKNEKDMNDTQSRKQKVDIAKKLIMSNKQLKELPEEDLDFSNQTIPGTVLLDHNLLSTIPSSLGCISEFLVKIDLDYNCIEQFSLTIEGMVFPNLKSLKLSQNRMKQLTANGESSFPHLEELVLNNNLLTSLPDNMASILPELKILSISSNKLDNISIDMFGKKLEILNLSNNDIGYLPPELSTITTLKELTVFGNRFRVPRPAIVDQGTRAVLEFLRHRVRN
ncbi:L domain-like protein [Rhizopus microsporus var. microsporus]|nr:L domain-like protein [Rhizopus microsporus var. microsporus]